MEVSRPRDAESRASDTPGDTILHRSAKRIPHLKATLLTLLPALITLGACPANVGEDRRWGTRRGKSYLEEEGGLGETTRRFEGV